MDHRLAHIEHVARLTHVQDRDTTDSVLVEVLGALLHSASVSLIEVIDVDGLARCLVRAHFEPGMVAPTSTPLWTDAQDYPLLVANEAWFKCAQTRHTQVLTEGAHAHLCVPVVTDAETFLMIDVKSEGGYVSEILPLVEGMAKIFRNFLNLLDSSERDSLTSLLNRKSFDDTFLRATRQSCLVPPDDSTAGVLHRAGTAGYWLGVIDIDHFKRVNDGFGHLIGDEVLLLVARIMRSTFRHDDRLYRFGGEEFVVLVRASDEAGAEAVFERFRQNVQTYQFPQVGTITISIGFTQMRHGDTPSAAFERADKVVYKAKAHGRNQVRCYEQEPEFSGHAESHDSSDVELF